MARHWKDSVSKGCQNNRNTVNKQTNKETNTYKIYRYSKTDTKSSGILLQERYEILLQDGQKILLQEK